MELREVIEILRCPSTWILCASVGFTSALTVLLILRGA
jgi:hypothetical protein